MEAIRGLNRAFGVDEERPSSRRRLVGLVLLRVLMAFTTAAMLLLAYGVPMAEMLAQNMGLGPAFVLAWQIVQAGFIVLLPDMGLSGVAL